MGFVRLCSRNARASGSHCRRLPARIWLLHGQRVIDELGLFAVMPLEHAGRRGGRLDTAGIAGTARLDLSRDDAVFQAPVDEGPGAHVARLFLAPYDIGLSLARQFAGQRCPAERIEVVQPDDLDVLYAAPPARPERVG